MPRNRRACHGVSAHCRRADVERLPCDCRTIAERAGVDQLIRGARCRSDVGVMGTRQRGWTAAFARRSSVPGVGPQNPEHEHNRRNDQPDRREDERGDPAGQEAADQHHEGEREQKGGKPSPRAPCRQRSLQRALASAVCRRAVCPGRCLAELLAGFGPEQSWPRPPPWVRRRGAWERKAKRRGM